MRMKLEYILTFHQENLDNTDWTTGQELKASPNQDWGEGDQIYAAFMLSIADHEKVLEV